jgi:hypothetical protein
MIAKLNQIYNLPIKRTDEVEGYPTINRRKYPILHNTQKDFIQELDKELCFLVLKLKD